MKLINAPVVLSSSPSGPPSPNKATSNSAKGKTKSPKGTGKGKSKYGDLASYYYYPSKAPKAKSPKDGKGEGKSKHQSPLRNESVNNVPFGRRDRMMLTEQGKAEGKREEIEIMLVIMAKEQHEGELSMFSSSYPSKSISRGKINKSSKKSESSKIAKGKKKSNVNTTSEHHFKGKKRKHTSEYGDVRALSMAE
jgi:hypothetical protein